MKNSPFPKPPGLDLSDPKTLSGAKGVATRKNNAFKKMVDTKLPLFKEELFSEYEPETPETVIEQRRAERAGWKIKKREINDFERRTIRETRTAVKEMLGNEKEFGNIIRWVVRVRGGNRMMRWLRAKTLVERRMTKALSETADLVLAWLQQEERPVTHFEIWEKRGDGLTHMQILNALMELMEFAYVGMVEVVNLPVKYHDLENWKSNTAWSWEAVKPE